MDEPLGSRLLKNLVCVKPVLVQAKLLETKERVTALVALPLVSPCVLISFKNPIAHLVHLCPVVVCYWIMIDLVLDATHATRVSFFLRDIKTRKMTSYRTFLYLQIHAMFAPTLLLAPASVAAEPPFIDMRTMTTNVASADTIIQPEDIIKYDSGGW